MGEISIGAMVAPGLAMVVVVGVLTVVVPSPEVQAKFSLPTGASAADDRTPAQRAAETKQKFVAAVYRGGLRIGRLFPAWTRSSEELRAPSVSTPGGAATRVTTGCRWAVGASGQQASLVFAALRTTVAPAKLDGRTGAIRKVSSV